MALFLKFIFLMGVFILCFLIIFFSLWIVNKKRLFSLKGLILTAFGVGFGFFIVAFLGSFLDKKSQDWEFFTRIGMASWIFLFSFIGTLIAVPLSLSILKAMKKFL